MLVMIQVVLHHAAGSPYQTVVYTGLTPVVSTARAITAINGVPAAAGAPVTGRRFVVTLKQQPGGDTRAELHEASRALWWDVSSEGRKNMGQGPRSTVNLALAGCHGCCSTMWHQHRQRDQAQLWSLPHVCSHLLHTWSVNTSSPVTLMLAGSQRLTALAPFNGAASHTKGT